MNLMWTVFLLLGFFPVLAYAQKPALPAVFNQAHYVFVQAVDGDAYNLNLLPEDREAILDVKTALQKWGRYAVTENRSEADIVFVVRAGRLGTLSGRGVAGRSPRGPQAGQWNGAGASGELGPPDDLLWVCRLDRSGKLGAPLWTRTEKDGLASPDVPLFREFASAMDRDYPQKTATTKKP